MSAADLNATRAALLLDLARMCLSIDAPETWEEDDSRWRVETHFGRYYGATLDEALIELWRSEHQKKDGDGIAIEPDPFVDASGAAATPCACWPGRMCDDAKVQACAQAAKPAVQGLDALLAKINELPKTQAPEVDGEFRFSGRPYVSLTQLERLLRSL